MPQMLCLLKGLPNFKHNDITATFNHSCGGVFLRSVCLITHSGNWLMRVIQGDDHEALYVVCGFA